MCDFLYVKSSSGNVGMSLASKEIIYFFDEDTILEPGYLHQMNKNLKQIGK